ncbi:hypothetical protein AB669_07540 [Pedobacter sp. BMA]|nr:hypothetical protein AB669_07540 [Pedobacter sp. BMA]
MRLFYIIIFTIFSVSFACHSSQRKNDIASEKSFKISFISGKKQTKFLSDFGQDSESLQRDFISSPLVKTFCSTFLLLVLFYCCLLKISIPDKKARINRLRLNYCCLFKQLYLKHIFW